MNGAATSAPNAVYVSGLKQGAGASRLDILLAALPIAACLFNTQIGSLSVILLFGSLCLIAWLRIEKLPATLARGWPILVIPGFALLSVIWSLDPAATARYGLLYAFTIVTGLLIAGCLDRRSILLGLLLAYTLFHLTGYAIGGDTSVGYKTGIRAYIGIAGGKNMAGSSAAIIFLLGLVVFFLGIQKRSAGMVFAAIAGMVMGAISVVLAKSAGAMIGGGTAALCIVMWLISRRMSRQARASILFITVLMVTIALATLEIWLPLLFDLVLSGTGKDAGLTGRIDLWRKADQLISQRPWLGQGFAAFWVPGNLDAENIWRAFNIKAKTGFNFHNTPRDFLVALGWVGSSLFLIIALCATVALFWRTMIRPDLTRIFFCGWLVYVIMRSYFESVGISTVYAETIMTATALSLGFIRDDAPAQSAKTGSR